MSARRAVAYVVGRSRAADRHPGQLGQLCVAEKPWTSRAASYCATRRESNSSGSSAPSAIRTPASNSSRKGTARKIGIDAQGDVRLWTDLERDSRIGQVRDQGRVLDRSDAVPDAVCARVRPGRTTRSPRRAARRRAARRTGPPGLAMSNALANASASPRRSSFDRPKPTTPRPAYWAASRASVRASSGCRVRLAAISDRDGDPGTVGGLARSVQHQIGEGA